MQNIVTLGEINDALKIAAVSAAQLADMGFAALANKPICEGLPPEESRRLRNAKLYPAESIGQIRVALAQRFAQPAAAADVPASGAAALSEYLENCEQHAIVPDVGGAFASAFASGFNLATSQAAPDERTDLVPGVMRCAKCEFQLVRQVLAVNLGEVFAGDSKTEPCPNDCGPLWPVTWKQYAEQAMDAAESMADRAFAAEKEVKQLRGELSALDASNLRTKIMSTPLGLYGTGIGDIGIAYRAGHRAARLTAADLVASTVVAAPAAVAVPDAVRDAEKLLRAEAARLERIYGAGKWYGFSAEKASHLEHLRVADALAATPANCDSLEQLNENNGLSAAAPVVLPEPAGCLVYADGETHHWDANQECAELFVEREKKNGAPYAFTYENLYTEQQLRALLATATGLPAQAVPLKLIEAINTACGGNAWQGDALVTDLLEPACRAIASLSPLAQADAREAQLLAFAVSEIRRDEMTDSELLDAMEQKRISVVPEYEGPWDAEIYNDEGKPNHRGSGSTPREAIRAAIAAAKGEQQ
ncbi:hypothetical protein [Comamonas testosteroni]|uniref:hypothetical protein n=1 Tax=Comamonas testosteroni TaxID=285 RepID=UPI0005B4EF1E|nr:hypothetical protein [Comamonas testosteroni]